MRMIPAFRASLVLALLICMSAAIALAQITPSDDSYTLASTPTVNFGAKNTLEVESTGATTFVRFDLSGIPSTVTGAMVANATLKIYVSTVTTAGSFNVDLVTSPWTESTITANNTPTLGSAIASAIPVTPTDKNKYVLVDVTAAAVDWLNGTANDGIAIVPDGAVSFALNSKETTTTSHPAELDIVLTGPAGPPGPISGVTAGAGLTGGGTNGNVTLSLLTTCSSGQVLQWNGSTWVCATSKGTGTITGVTAGTDLTGGGTNGNVTLNLDSTKVPQLAASNNFTGTQTITNGILNLSPTSGSQIGSVYIGGVPFLQGYGKNNVFVGGAGNFSTTGSFTAAVGYQALLSQSSGYGNTAVGDVALFEDTTGFYNTAVGNAALFSNTSGTLNTAIGASSGPSLGSSALTNTTAVGAGATVSQSNSLVLGQTTTSSPGTAFVNVGIGTASPRSILEVAQSATGVLGPVITLTNPAGQSGAAAAIDFNTSTPAGGPGYIPNAEIRAFDAGGYTDNLDFFSNKPGANNNGFQLNMEIAANGQVGIGTSVPAYEAQLVIVQSESNIGAIQGYGQTILSGTYAGDGGNAIKGTGGDSTGNNYAGAGAEFIGGNNYESGEAGDGFYASPGIGGLFHGYAGEMFGDVVITGNTSNFGSENPSDVGVRIDHPSDPANKYLTLSSVQSPEMVNLYSGNVTTDELGLATVVLPEWFDAMNGDFRYQLTVVGGQFAQAIVSKEIENHQFMISTNAARVKVSWQVTAVRQDAYAKANPLEVEKLKPANEQGYYIHPEFYGQPEEKQILWARRPELMKRMKEKRQQPSSPHASMAEKSGPAAPATR